MKNSKGVYLKVPLLFIVMILSAWLVNIEFFKTKEHDPSLLAKDGNFLFYNGPVAAPHKDGFFLAYLTSNGKIMLDLWQQNQLIDSIVMHDYDDQIIDDLGEADDHAAPAIIHDLNNKRLLLATAYHGTDMHVYGYNLETGNVDVLSTWKGQYTYPRFLATEHGITLIARKQKNDVLAGDLIARSSHDGFQEETVVLPSAEGHVIYAGSPVPSQSGFYLTYSTHSYAENRLIGFDLIEYDLDQKKIINYCNLEQHIDKNYFSNRPTGLGVKGRRLTLGTSFFGNEDVALSAEDENFTELNTVAILEGEIEQCDSFRVVEEQKGVKIPYYHTSVAVNNFGDYLFFSKDKVFTNLDLNNYSSCFNKDNLMYPNFFDRDFVFYASMNSSYAIRNFNNSLFICKNENI